MMSRLFFIATQGFDGMKMILPLSLALSVCAFSVQADDTAAKPEGMKDRLSYFIGYNSGQKLVQQEMDVNADQVIQGLKDALAAKESALSDEEIKETLMAFQQQRKEEEAKAAQANLEAGQKFLADNKAKEGVVTLDSGLQYKVLTEGKGKQPKADDTVVTHYRGTLIDGTEFDSSYSRNQPAEFPVGGVIKGWTEALQLMKEGAKWQLFIPAELAYGERGAGGHIPGNSALIFEVELLEVKPKAE